MAQDLFVDLGTGFGEDELRKELAKIATPLKPAPGGTLFRQGEAPCGVFLVFRGTVSLFISLPNGLRLPFPGRVNWLLGLPAIVTGNPYSLTAEAEEGAEVAFVERSQVLELLRKRPELLWSVMRIIADEVQHLRVTSAQWTWLALSKRKEPGEQAAKAQRHSTPAVAS